MPFANYKLPQASLSRAQKEDLIHKTTELMVSCFGEVVRPTTMVLIEEVPDGGYGRADEVFVMPEEYRAKD
ncbi:4-oxalocrotonate tautomerase family protein [Nitratireductor sp. ZSWI3]|uniref:tautomerase family protein n=1 Tax=Nitratireductor sp. ZSWI3 TaxID=2966359 RepID=UPI002150640F|nr:4-oxalocrotonate tautomerase family protein [Nitratireductor sp. ZSWI3]MCR4265467.1 4-oxalocrotonate tautomerase family protein [Nitratireductor sp. ZSWI3]